MMSESEAAIKAVIFDFDGVIVESEILSGKVLSQSLTAAGLAISPQDAVTRFFGQRLRDTMPTFFAEHGRIMPPNFIRDVRVLDDAIHAAELVAVEGAADFIAGLGDVPRAIASSSSGDVIERNLEKVGLRAAFGTQIYSAALLERGKPYPDVYLNAASGLGIKPAYCMAIEDSLIGARAALAAGMHVIGLTVGTHIFDKSAHDIALRALGVHQVAHSFADIALPLTA